MQDGKFIIQEIESTAKQCQSGGRFPTSTGSHEKSGAAACGNRSRMKTIVAKGANGNDADEIGNVSQGDVLHGRNCGPFEQPQRLRGFLYLESKRLRTGFAFRREAICDEQAYQPQP
jgi:hypothetical protein